MITNPFLNRVGLHPVSEPAGCTVWLNDLPGLPGELTRSVAGPADKTTGNPTGALATFQRLQRLAYEKLISLIEAELSKSADFRYELARIEPVADASDMPGVTVPLTGMLGVTVQVPARMPYSELYLSSLWVQVVGAGVPNWSLASTLRVLDAATGRELYSRAVTLTAGLNTLTMDYTQAMLRGQPAGITVGLDVPAGLVVVPLSPAVIDWYTPGGLTSPDYESAVVLLTGGVNSSLLPPGGLISLDIRHRCGLDRVVSAYSERLTWAYAYLLGSALMTEKLASPNLNLFTTTNRAFTEELETRFGAEGVTRIKPVTRDILKELTALPEPAVQRDAMFQPGYYGQSFI